MATYNDPPPLVTGDNITASWWETYFRQNQLAMIPGAFTEAGELAYAAAAKTMGILSKESNFSILSLVDGLPAWQSVFPHAVAKFLGTHSLNDSTDWYVQFTSEVYDTHNFIDLGSDDDAITIPTGMGGRYLSFGLIEYATNSSGFRLAGINQSYQFTDNPGVTLLSAAPGIPTILTCWRIENLSAGAKIRLCSRQGSGGAINVLSGILATIYLGPAS